ncbi:Cell wall-associated hydrolases (invasion-associated proteins) [Paenibacillus uliginis N3/975]|uniref:Cell wall-associated hydrolases (Invasion-associated proteins) n=1 Tax=Paenibacillus uliginis N3/975 TaxID=1313296 RepID=A0A1X7HE09_9BACL|nr:Cell wall-associated hydrolases (invasion-associated proteins) [Paenibacillus uliginis N3/975]
MNTTFNKRRFRNFGIGVSLGIALFSVGTGFIDNTNTAYAATATTTGDQVISTGLKYQGVPYKFGAESGRTDAFDCSSFTQFVFNQNGVSIPRSSRQQSTAGTFVPRDQLQPGDLVFFYSPIHHVAIYMGDGKIIHTFGEGGVTVTPLNTGWWNSHYSTARRVLPSNGQAVVNSDSRHAATSPATTAPTPSGNPSPDQAYDDGEQNEN